jgi:hypothetical protein
MDPGWGSGGEKGEGEKRRKIRLIEGNAKCRHLKKSDL